MGIHVVYIRIRKRGADEETGPFVVCDRFGVGDADGLWAAGASEKPSISYEELKKQLMAGETVKGRTVHGDDVIRFIKETTDHEKPPAVSLEDCVVEKGLDFTQLKRVPIEEVKLPKEWDEKKRTEFKAKYKQARVVKNDIRIIRCDIRAEIRVKSKMRKDPFSIYATEFNVWNPLFFYLNVDFQNTKFNGDAFFLKASFTKYADFVFTNFSGNAYFSWASFSSDADFGAASFNGVTPFWKASFKGNAYFALASFNGKANFGEASFGKYASFNETSFNSDADFESASFSDDASFWEVSFSDEAKFSWAKFSGDAYFESVSFNGDAYFESVSFNGDASFGSASFNSNANFSDAIFEKNNDFKDSGVYRLVLESSKFNSYGDFRRAGIQQLNFNSAKKPSIISAHMDFRKAKISSAHFQDVIFQKDVDFSDAQFGYNHEKDPSFIGPPRPDSDYKPHDFNSVFRYVTFESDAYFTRTKFHDAVAFERTNFKKEANFKETNFKRKEGKSKFSFSYLNFNKLLINWNQLPKIGRWITNSGERIKSFSDAEKEAKAKEEKKPLPTPEKPECISEVLKGLEENFRAHKQLDDANAAHFHRKKNALEELRSGKRTGSRLWPETEWIVWGLACGYGTKISWALGWSFLFVILFALIYKKDVIRIRPSHAEVAEQTRQDHTVRQRIFEWPWLYVESNRNLSRFSRFEKFINAMRFSVVIFFKFGPRDTTISGRFWRIDYLYMIWIEWILGFYMLACMFYTLSNSLPLLNQLIRGLF